MTFVRVGIYLVGLVLVLAAVGLLLTQTGLAAVLPASILLVLFLMLLGVGIMRGAEVAQEPHGHGPHGHPGEVIERRRRWW